ncbi:MAG TPA: HAMP domain-containing sensor histidine kinase [Puia sp.]|nr:HAMP domain-containing sensor histidine kinase [Puia sp.]
MNKRRISIVLMVVTIAAIALFQAYWLRKSYMEENRLLTLRTHLLFRETLFKLQASKLHLDTSLVRFPKTPDPMGVVSTVNIVRERVSMDTGIKGHAAASMIVTMDGEPGERVPDTSLHEMVIKMQGPSRVASFLMGVDSLQAPPSEKEVHDKFAQAMTKEGIYASFTIKMTPVDRSKDHFFPDNDESNVILGMARPMSYQVQLGSTFWLLARRLGPQLLFSLVLVGVTVLSFLLLYRNWRQQQKLIILKNDFISNITHELKTPIATVSVAVEALKEFDALKDPVRTREYLEISTHELKRLSLLVDKVLKLSLFEKQEIELRKDEFDLKVLVEDIMGSMRLQFEKYRASVRFWSGPNEPGIWVVGPGRNSGGEAGKGGVDGMEGDVDGAGGDNRNTGRIEPRNSDPGKFKLRADKLHFTSVIYNLLDNALKYSKDAPKVMVHLQGEEEFVLLSVSDNGIGIPAGYKDRIFEKFFRVPTGDHHNIKGYGLGLSYVAYVVKRHGGEVEVRSEEGVGSHFTIKIPRDHV